MVFKFTGKGLFIAAGVVCIITVLFAPISLVFFYMAFTTKMEIQGNNLIYKMLLTKTIPFDSITKMYIKKTQEVRQYISSSYTSITITKVTPMVIEYGNNKKIKFSLNFFQNNGELLHQLEEKTGKKIEWPDHNN